MSKENQIEELAKIMCDKCSNPYCEYREKNIVCDAVYDHAQDIYNAGYRKQKEGHWFILEYEYFTCSECGYYHPNGCDTTKEAKEKLADGKVPKYCSECGAKMKGGEG